jgi:hypothetical protein
LPLRLIFCDFLAACAYTTLARGDDNVQSSVREIFLTGCRLCLTNQLQHYIAVRRHSENFRKTASEQIERGKIEGSAKSDIITKYVQVAKLEIEAALKLENWDALHELYHECWKYGNTEHWDKLADLVLVVHSTLVKGNVDGKYQASMYPLIHCTCYQLMNDLQRLLKRYR